MYTDSMDPMLKAGHQVAHLDPIPIISAMASVTDTVAFAATASTSYVNPYILARQYSTLDHLTDGRVGWNIVTSWSKAAAKALGQDDVIPHDERYVIADEYMDLVYKLWESSWATDSAVWSNEMAFDPSKIKKVEHNGKFSLNVEMETILTVSRKISQMFCSQPSAPVAAENASSVSSRNFEVGLCFCF